MSINTAKVDFRIPKNSNTLVFGVSSSGKTSLVLQYLDNQTKCFVEPFDKIFWCYGIIQPKLFALLETKYGKNNIEFQEGIDSLIQFIDHHDVDYFSKYNYVFIVDDLDYELFGSERVKNIFIKKSHHLGFSLIAMIQSPDIETKFRVSILRNTHTYIILASPLLYSALRTINRNILPHLPQILSQLNKKLIERKPFSYFVLNMSARHNHEYCLYNNLLGDFINVFIRD
jgi:hypothetical protein